MNQKYVPLLVIVLGALTIGLNVYDLYVNPRGAGLLGIFIGIAILCVFFIGMLIKARRSRGDLVA